MINWSGLKPKSGIIKHDGSFQASVWAHFLDEINPDFPFLSIQQGAEVNRAAVTLEAVMWIIDQEQTNRQGDIFVSFLD